MENIAEIAETIRQGDTAYLIDWLKEVVSERGVLEKTERAKKLLEKLAEYKPLAKIEEMEEQNYNMVDNVLNNGAGEKAKKEENKKGKSHPASLKTRLAEKKEQVVGQNNEMRENVRGNNREV